MTFPSYKHFKFREEDKRYFLYINIFKSREEDKRYFLYINILNLEKKINDISLLWTL